VLLLLHPISNNVEFLQEPYDGAYHQIIIALTHERHQRIQHHDYHWHHGLMVDDSNIIIELLMFEWLLLFLALPMTSLPLMASARRPVVVAVEAKKA
jgi:hypothetical protein